MLFRVLALVQKEFLALLKDRQSRFVIIGPPIIQLVVFGYAATFDVTNVPVAVLDECNTLLSRDLTARFVASPNFQLVARLEQPGQIAPVLDRQQAMLVLHIRQDFQRKLSTLGTTEVQLILDGRNSNTALIVLGYAQGIIEEFNATLRRRRGRLAQVPAQVVSRAWFNPNLQSQWFIVPGIVGLLTLVVTMLVTALSVAREREQGTFDQLLVTPYRPYELLLGKALPGFLIGLVEATFIVLVAVFWFRVPLVGSLGVLYLGVAVFLLSAIGVGLMISSLANTQQQGLLGAFLFLVPAIILSGFATPIANMPPAVQKLTLVNPMRYYLVILRGVFLQGATLEELADQFWPMLGIAAVTLAVATVMFRRRIY